eukprot:EC716103.1.p1 GENE.EC716103.1~~EC716103.1.p1  ORF type:complete len:187 (+),score=38.37 EC716103.1:15-575(+)
MLRLAIFISLLIAVVLAQGPHLVADKSIDGDAVQHQNMTIRIRIWNVGSAPAFNVNVTDKTWSLAAEHYALIDGSLEALYERIGPNENVTHTYTLIPKVYGSLNDLPPATLKYSSSQDGSDTVTAYTAVSGMRFIYSQAAWDKVHSWRNWAITMSLLAASLGAPLAAYGYVQLNYDKGLPKKSKSA